MKRDEWFELARDLDWTWSEAREEAAFPAAMAGAPWLATDAWAGWAEPFRISSAEYVRTQHEKDATIAGVRDAVGRAQDVAKLDPVWLNALKLHAATLPLAEFAAVVGNL